MQQVAKYLIIIGIIIFLIGVVLYFSGNKIGWIGRLPGDIRIERENFKFYFPLTTSLIISIAISLLIWIIRKIL